MHDVLRYLLRPAGLPATVTELLLLATIEVTVHMGGHNGVTKALAPLIAGVAQGCLASAMVCCIVAEVRAFLALLHVTPGAVLDRSVRQQYAKQQDMEYHPAVASYADYASCIASGSLSWE